MTEEHNRVRSLVPFFEEQSRQSNYTYHRSLRLDIRRRPRKCVPGTMKVEHIPTKSVHLLRDLDELTVIIRLWKQEIRKDDLFDVPPFPP